MILGGVINGSLAAIRLSEPHLEKLQLVNIGSTVSEIAMQERTGYNAAKHGVFGFTGQLLEEYRGYGLQAMVMEFGRIATEFVENLIQKYKGDPKELRSWLNTTAGAMGRMLQPEEAASTVVSLLSPKSYVVGPVDVMGFHNAINFEHLKTGVLANYRPPT